MKIEKDEYDCDRIVLENEDDVLTLLQATEDLCMRALPIAKVMAEKEYGYKSLDVYDIKIEDGHLTYEFEKSLCCGEWETISDVIPTRYLFDETYVEEIQAELEEKKRQEEERKRKEQERAEIARKAREYNQYLKLKEQYEGGVK